MKNPMLLKPTPTELDGPLRSERDIARHRRLYCVHYAGCLDESINKSWGGFSCMRCPISELTGEERLRVSAAEQRKGDRFNP